MRDVVLYFNFWTFGGSLCDFGTRVIVASQILDLSFIGEYLVG